MNTITLQNPDSVDFKNAYEVLCGQDSLKEQTTDLVSLVTSQKTGKTTFGTCEVAWITVDDEKFVILSNKKSKLKLNLPGVISLKTFQPTVVLVSESMGGIFAYFNNEETANEIATALNELQKSDDEDLEYFIMDFDPASHTADYEKSLSNQELSTLSGPQGILGNAITRNPETLKFLII